MRALLVAALAAGVAACATPPPKPAPAMKSRVVLLPDASGEVGKVHVGGDKGASALLEQPYATATVDASAQLKTAVLDEARVRREYGAIIDALPETFTLYFEGNLPSMTTESQAAAAGIYDRVAKKPNAEVSVIGYTDRQGSRGYNERLSRDRAAAVAEQLKQRGIPAARIKVEGRGDRDPAVPTEPGAVEPRNRRVEITVR